MRCAPSPLDACARITEESSSSRSPPPWLTDEWMIALESAGGPRLRVYLRRMVGSPEVVEDILRDTCERFLRHVRGGRRVSGAWVRDVTRHLAVSYLRQKRRHAEVVLPEEAPELSTASTVVESEAEYQQSMERFSGALGALSGGQKRLIDLHYWRGMKVKDIAELWGKSVQAVEQRLTRARNRLRAAAGLE
jgi:RNA polymerase sigma factor (sigma-70 family)